jgi:F-type H+-transporting ATPase subunit alpha
MPVENQVAVIYAVTNGYLDQVPVDRVRAWERGFHRHLESRHGDVLSGIREEQQLTDEIRDAMIAAIESYNETFEAEEAARDEQPAGATA